MRRALALAAFALSLMAVPASPEVAQAREQERVTITAEDARQCAIWASFLSTELADDQETAQALLFAVNYFVGVYEGKTGRSIATGDNMAAGNALAADMEGVTQRCADHMTGYGERMVAWGAVLERLGTQGANR